MVSNCLHWLEEKTDFHAINGLVSKREKIRFMFYHGKLRSQNDLVVTNSYDLVSSFSIMDKVVYSDH